MLLYFCPCTKLCFSFSLIYCTYIIYILTLCTQATGAITVVIHVACGSGLQFVSNEPGMHLASELA